MLELLQLLRNDLSAIERNGTAFNVDGIVLYAVDRQCPLTTLPLLRLLWFKVPPLAANQAGVPDAAQAKTELDLQAVRANSSEQHERATGALPETPFLQNSNNARI